MRKSFLHIGCGQKTKIHTTPGFQADEWREIRLDIDPAVAPEILGTMTDMAAVQAGAVDAIFSSHNIEHLYPHEVPIAFGEFLRVLNEDGFVVITCPDLKSIAPLIADDKLTDAAYISPAGPITPLDVLYGHRPSIAKGNHFMAHRCGFTEKVLSATLVGSGFRKVGTITRPADFALWAVASKSDRSDADMQALARAHFPL